MAETLARPRISTESVRKLWTIKEALARDRKPLEPRWAEIARHVNPNMSDWNDNPPNTHPDKKNDRKDIYDNEGFKRSNEFSDMMQSYSFGRNLDWQRTVTEDADLMENRDAAEWLQDSNLRASAVLARSRFYDEGRGFVKSWADFGTAVMFREFDEATMRFVYNTLHLKRCFIDESRFGEVDVLFRDLWLTQAEAKNEFGEGSLPNAIRQALGETAIRYFKFTQFILPIDRYDLDLDARAIRKKDFYSVYIADIDKEHPIREGGYASRPFYCARWSRSLDGGVWGVDSPGMIEYSTFRQLNAERREFSGGVQLGFQPPIKATEGMRAEGVHFEPRHQHFLRAGQDFTTVPVQGPFEPVMKDMEDLRKSIRESYYTDLLKTFSAYLERVKTATEVAAIKGELAAQLAALSGRQHYEFLEPAVEDVFQTMLEYGQFRPIPESLRGQTIKVDLVSPMAQLQKRYLMLNETDEYIGRMLQAAQVSQDMSILDKIDWDGYSEVIQESYNVDVRVARDMMDVQRLRVARARAQAQAQAQAMAMEQAKTQAQVLAAGSKAPEPGSPTSLIMRGQQ